MKKQLLTGAMIALLVVVFIATGLAVAGPAERIEVWVIRGLIEELEQQVVREFEAEYGVRAEIRVIPQEVIFEKLSAGIAAGVGPDLVSLNRGMVFELASKKAVVSYNEFIGKGWPKYSRYFVLEEELYGMPIPITSFTWAIPKVSKRPKLAYEFSIFMYKRLMEVVEERAVRVKLVGMAITPEFEEEPVRKGIPGSLLIFVRKSGVVGLAIDIPYPEKHPFEMMSGYTGVTKNITNIPKWKKEITGLDISDYINGAFISLRVLEDGIGKLHLATYTESTRYSLRGEIEEPIDELGFIRTRKVEITPRVEAPVEIEMRPMEVKVKYLKAYKKGSHTKYGLVHEVFFDAANSDPENVPAKMEDCNDIMIGVIVDAPTAADIKADLSFYNKNSLFWIHTWFCQMHPSGIQRDLLAYEIDTHGYPLVGADWNSVTATDITNLWYSSWFISVHMTDAIILADACYSLQPDDGTARAFVDDGSAATYVGTTVGVPIDMDGFTEEFWDSLVDDGQTVWCAQDDAESVRGLAHTDFDVYGNEGTRCEP